VESGFSEPLYRARSQKVLPELSAPSPWLDKFWPVKGKEGFATAPLSGVP